MEAMPRRLKNTVEQEFAEACSQVPLFSSPSSSFSVVETLFLDFFSLISIFQVNQIAEVRLRKCVSESKL